MKITITVPMFRRRIGAGTAIQKAIHAGVDALPVSHETKVKIKRCTGCGRRAAKLNRAIPNLNPFAGPHPPVMQPPPEPPSP